MPGQFAGVCSNLNSENPVEQILWWCRQRRRAMCRGNIHSGWKESSVKIKRRMFRHQRRWCVNIVNKAMCFHKVLLQLDHLYFVVAATIAFAGFHATLRTKIFV